MAKRFLTADWRNLLMVSYALPPETLLPHLPPELEPDTMEGHAFVSVVAFDFLNTRVKGIKVPFHVNFPEINLRYYARLRATGERGVGFVREIVPLHAITLVANTLYNEHYATYPTRSKHQVMSAFRRTRYQTRVGGRWHTLEATVDPTAHFPEPGGVEDFFKEQVWGFGRTRGGSLLRYAVHHPRWRLHKLHAHKLDVDFNELYGPKWAFLQGQAPHHVMYAEGSAVEVYSVE